VIVLPSISLDHQGLKGSQAKHRKRAFFLFKMFYQSSAFSFRPAKRDGIHQSQAFFG
jgi:hypothetical protein